MDSLKAELNTALHCDREAEEEVKKLKVRRKTKMTRNRNSTHYITYFRSKYGCLEFPPSNPSQDHTADLKQRIEAQFSDLHQFLYQEEKLLQVKLKTEERRELIRLDEHKALLCVEISRLQRAVQEIEDKLKEQDPFTLLRVSLIYTTFMLSNSCGGEISYWRMIVVFCYTKQFTLKILELFRRSFMLNSSASSSTFKP